MADPPIDPERGGLLAGPIPAAAGPIPAAAGSSPGVAGPIPVPARLVPPRLLWLVIAGSLGTSVVLGSRDPVLWLLGALGFAGAFLSGLVGVGGAIVMIPLLLYVPPILGFAGLDIRTVAGITIVQVTVAGAVGFTGHRGRIDRRLVLAVGASMTLAAFAGGLASASVDPLVLRAVFATMAAAAAVVTLALRHRTTPWYPGPLAFSRPLAATLGAGIGFFAALIGAGGAFLLMPAMLFWLRIPVRAAVGASLATVAISAGAGLLGKAVTGQVDWTLAAGLVAGALPGSLVGALVSHRTRVEHLATVLGVVIALVALKMWLEILG